MIQFGCPKCGGTLTYTRMDSFVQHWQCAECGLTDAGLTYTVSAGTAAPHLENARLRAENALLKRTIARMAEDHNHPRTYASAGLSITLNKEARNEAD